MPLVTNLQRHPKTWIYLFRRVVPVRLRATVGKREIVRSLGTKDPIEAKRLRDGVAREVQALLDSASLNSAQADLRSGATDIPPAPIEAATDMAKAVPPARVAPQTAGFQAPQPFPHVAPITPAEASEWAQAWCVADLRRCLERYPAHRTDQERAALCLSLRRNIERWRQWQEQADWDGVRGLAHGVLSRQHRRLPADGLEVLGPPLVRALIHSAEIQLRWLQGDLSVPISPVPTIEGPAVAKVLDEPASVARARGGVVPGSEAGNRKRPRLLADLMALYLRESAMAPRSRHELQTAVAMFGEVVGADRELLSLQRDDGRDFKNELLEKPRKIKHSDRNLTLPQLVTKYKEVEGVRRITAETVKKTLNLLSALCVWGRDEGYMTQNPFEKIRPRAQPGQVSRRRDFTPEEMLKVFSAPIYRGCKSDQEWWLPGHLVQKNARYWLPLIGAYMGPRLEEIGQALVADVFEQRGVWVLNIDVGDGPTDDPADAARSAKHLKTKSSKRMIPIHPVLIQAGFVDYVDAQRRRGEARLFPELHYDRHGCCTSAFSKWFARFLDRLDLKDRALVFHSWRHGFKTACRAAGLPKDIHDFLTGHGPANVGDTYGSHDIQVLGRGVATITYPLVDALFSKDREGAPSGCSERAS